MSFWAKGRDRRGVTGLWQLPSIKLFRSGDATVEIAPPINDLDWENDVMKSPLSRTQEVPQYTSNAHSLANKQCLTSKPSNHLESEQIVKIERWAKNSDNAGKELSRYEKVLEARRDLITPWGEVEPMKDQHKTSLFPLTSSVWFSPGSCPDRSRSARIH